MPGSLGTQHQSSAKSSVSSASPLNLTYSCSKGKELSSEDFKSPVIFANLELFPQVIFFFHTALPGTPGLARNFPFLLPKIL